MEDIRQHLPCRLRLHARFARVSERRGLSGRPERPLVAAGDSQLRNFRRVEHLRTDGEFQNLAARVA